MSVNVSPISTQDVSTQTVATPGVLTSTFEERWAAWQARGAAHDRAVRRKTAIAAPILVAIAAVLYVLLIR
jgi:hypothetical protein